MNHLVIAHALIAIAESQEKIAKETDSIRGWLVGVEKNTAVIAEQLVLVNALKKIEMSIEVATASPTQEDK